MSDVLIVRYRGVQSCKELVFEEKFLCIRHYTENIWPKTFDDVIGQEHITNILKAQVVSGRLSHAYLFVGTKGTGKTTCARILAKP